MTVDIVPTINPNEIPPGKVAVRVMTPDGPGWSVRDADPHWRTVRTVNETLLDLLAVAALVAAVVISALLIYWCVP